MSLLGRKIAAFLKRVSDLPDRPSPTYSAAEIKAQFDSSPEELRVAVNGLIDDLSSTATGASGADQVGSAPISGVTGSTAYAQLASLKTLVDGAANQNAFSTVAVSGQSSVVADTVTDTLTLVGGTGITITTNAATDTVMITATGSATPGAHASTHISGGSDVIPNAVAGGSAGLLSGADKAKLDSALTTAGGTLTGLLTVDNSNNLKMKGWNDRVLDFIDGSDARRGYMGRIEQDETSNGMRIHNQVAGTAFDIRDNGEIWYNGKLVTNLSGDLYIRGTALAPTRQSAGNMEHWNGTNWFKVWSDVNTPASLGGNGYQKLPNGLLIQWGTTSVIPANSSQTVNFPLNFTGGAPFTVLVSMDSTLGNSNGMVSTYGVGSGSFGVNNSSSNGHAIRWIAIGTA